LYLSRYNCLPFFFLLSIKKLVVVVRAVEKMKTVVTYLIKRIICLDNLVEENGRMQTIPGGENTQKVADRRATEILCEISN
jgi:hypothetical protein